MKKRKLLYIGVAFVTFIAGVGIASYVLLPSRSFTLTSLDGAGGTSGLGVSRKGVNYSASSWISSDEQTVDELSIGYPSATDAENVFQLEQRQAEQVINLKKSRLVGKFGTSYKIIVLDGDDLHYITSPKLDVALDFERSWTKHFSFVPRPRYR
jgi:hypothetical protein